ncbi:unnamed protein product [Camellia sinensis]
MIQEPPIEFLTTVANQSTPSKPKGIRLSHAELFLAYYCRTHTDKTHFHPNFLSSTENQMVSPCVSMQATQRIALWVGDNSPIPVY